MTSYRVVLTVSFQKSAKQLKKRYANLNDDVRFAVRLLLAHPEAGYLIRGGGGARKLRVRNSDLRRGKRGGYRLIYSLSNDPDPIIYLLFLYAKSDRDDVTRKELAQLLDDLALR